MQKFKFLLPSLFLVLLALPQLLWIYAFNVSSNFREATVLYGKLFPLYNYIQPLSKGAYLIHFAILALLVLNAIYGGRVYNKKNPVLVAFVLVSMLVFLLYGWQML